jgi:hypothetical protein
MKRSKPKRRTPKNRHWQAILNRRKKIKQRPFLRKRRRNLVKLKVRNRLKPRRRKYLLSRNQLRMLNPKSHQRIKRKTRRGHQRK